MTGRRILGPAVLALLVLLALAPVTAAEQTKPKRGGADSADRLIFWVDCDELVGLSDAELTAWKSRGVDGFVCDVQWLRGMGGSQDFTGDPAKSLEGANYALQRALHSSDVVGRAADLGMKMYLGAYLVNNWNFATPLSEWFDGRRWRELVLPKLKNLAGAARLLGFAGIAFDQELYHQEGGVTTATWDWDYPGNTHLEEDVRAQARRRGRQIMREIVEAFPGVELVAYDVKFPETWTELIHNFLFGTENAFAPRLDINFWDGLSSVRGYAAIRLIDATFYKIAHRGTWDSALQYHYYRVASLLSRRFSNWDYASSRFFISPFSWIDDGPDAGSYDDARSPAYVLEQLLAFQKWGMGGEFANFAYRGVNGFDYSPYISAMNAASTPATVDPEPPSLAFAPLAGRSRKIRGTAQDNLAVWVVRWRDDRGAQGVARVRAEELPDGGPSGYPWQARWSFRRSELRPRATRVTITAEDIKGHTTTRRLSLGPPR